MPSQPRCPPHPSAAATTSDAQSAAETLEHHSWSFPGLLTGSPLPLQSPPRKTRCWRPGRSAAGAGAVVGGLFSTRCSSERANRPRSRRHPQERALTWGLGGFSYPLPLPGGGCSPPRRAGLPQHRSECPSISIFTESPRGFIWGSVGQYYTVGAALGRRGGCFPPSCTYSATPWTVYGAWSLIDVFVHYEFCSRIFFKSVRWGFFFFPFPVSVWFFL